MWPGSALPLVFEWMLRIFRYMACTRSTDRIVGCKRRSITSQRQFNALFSGIIDVILSQRYLDVGITLISPKVAVYLPLPMSMMTASLHTGFRNVPGRTSMLWRSARNKNLEMRLKNTQNGCVQRQCHKTIWNVHLSVRGVNGGLKLPQTGFGAAIFVPEASHNNFTSFSGMGFGPETYINLSRMHM